MSAVEARGVWEFHTTGFVAIAPGSLFCATDGQLAGFLGIRLSMSRSGEVIGFARGVELDRQSFVLFIGTLEFESCTYLLSILDLQNFTFHVKQLEEVSTDKIHLMTILKYMSGDHRLQHCQLKQEWASAWSSRGVVMLVSVSSSLESMAFSSAEVPLAQTLL